MRQSKKTIIAFIFSFFCLQLPTSLHASGDVFTSGRNDCWVSLNGNTASYDKRSVSLTPGALLTISAFDEEEEPLDAVIISDEGQEPNVKAGLWEWRAPAKPGLYKLTLQDRKSEQMVEISVFVTVPFKEIKKGYLRGYRIGRYPSSIWAQYSKPKGFIEVTAENQDTFVSPHFQLKQFLCKQNGGFPKYLILDERLLLKLEMILEKLNEDESRVETLEIISGYRTPGHNRGVASARLSRHIWGDAADFLVTVDLNEDGEVDFKDSELMREMIDQLEQENPTMFPSGGIGIYKKPGQHGPFIHVDARGMSARWINNPRKYKKHKKRRLRNTRHISSKSK